MTIYIVSNPVILWLYNVYDIIYIMSLVRCESLNIILVAFQEVLIRFSDLPFHGAFVMLRVNVSFPSGSGETLSLPEHSKVGDLKVLAQKNFQKGLPEARHCGCTCPHRP